MIRDVFLSRLVECYYITLEADNHDFDIRGSGSMTVPFVNSAAFRLKPLKPSSQ